MCSTEVAVGDSIVYRDYNLPICGVNMYCYKDSEFHYGKSHNAYCVFYYGSLSGNKGSDSCDCYVHLIKKAESILEEKEEARKAIDALFGGQ